MQVNQYEAKSRLSELVVAQALSEPLHLLTHRAALAPCSDLVIAV